MLACIIEVLGQSTDHDRKEACIPSCCLGDSLALLRHCPRPRDAAFSAVLREGCPRGGEACGGGRPLPFGGSFAGEAAAVGGWRPGREAEGAGRLACRGVSAQGVHGADARAAFFRMVRMRVRRAAGTLGHGRARGPWHHRRFGRDVRQRNQGRRHGARARRLGVAERPPLPHPAASADAVPQLHGRACVEPVGAWRDSRAALS